MAAIYSGGLKGLFDGDDAVGHLARTGGHVQHYRFGGPVTSEIAASGRQPDPDRRRQGASLAVFTTPHSFYFAREKDTNLGYVYYRKDAENATAWASDGGGRRADAWPASDGQPNQVQHRPLRAPPGTGRK